MAVPNYPVELVVYADAKCAGGNEGGTKCIVCIADDTPCFSEGIKLPGAVKVRKKDAGSKAYCMPNPFELRPSGEGVVYGRAGDWLLIGKKQAKIIKAEVFAEEFEVIG